VYTSRRLWDILCLGDTNLSVFFTGVFSVTKVTKCILKLRPIYLKNLFLFCSHGLESMFIFQCNMFNTDRLANRLPKLPKIFRKTLLASYSVHPPPPPWVSVLNDPCGFHQRTFCKISFKGISQKFASAFQFWFNSKKKNKYFARKSKYMYESVIVSCNLFARHWGLESSEQWKRKWKTSRPFRGTEYNQL
jgi:hypothetical protein